MLRSSALRQIALFGAFLPFAPFALVATACSSSSSGGEEGPGDSGDTGSSSSGAGSGSGGQSAADTGVAGDSASEVDVDGNVTAPDGNTASAGGPAPVVLGAAGTYVVLAKSEISNVATSVITGNLGLSPAAATYVTGLSLTKAGVDFTSAQVTGDIYAADSDPPTPSNLTTAVGAMQTAYTDAATRPTPNFLNTGGGAIGGTTLAPGLYKWTSAVTIASDVSISGGPTDEWIFQITGNLSMSAAKRMILSGGAQAKNIVWQVAGTVDMGATSHSEGVILCKTSITLETGASMNGRLMAQTAVTLAANTVTAPAP
jgi:Ice-binding-like